MRLSSQGSSTVASRQVKAVPSPRTPKRHRPRRPRGSFLRRKPDSRVHNRSGRAARERCGLKVDRRPQAYGRQLADVNGERLCRSATSESGAKPPHSKAAAARTFRLRDMIRGHYSEVTLRPPLRAPLGPFGTLKTEKLGIYRQSRQSHIDNLTTDHWSLTTG